MNISVRLLPPERLVALDYEILVTTIQKKCFVQLFKWRGKQELVIQMQIAMNPEDTSVCPNFTTGLISLTTFENSDYIIFPKEKPCA